MKLSLQVRILLSTLMVLILTLSKGVVAIHGGAVGAKSPGHGPETMPGSTFNLLAANH